MLHRGERRTLTTKQVRETEAEAVAFVDCQSVGLQNGTASQDYIQLWRGDANLLRETLEAVQTDASTTHALQILPPGCTLSKRAKGGSWSARQTRKMCRTRAIVSDAIPNSGESLPGREIK